MSQEHTVVLPRPREIARSHDVLKADVSIPVEEAIRFQTSLLKRFDRISADLGSIQVDDVMQNPNGGDPIHYTGERVRHITGSKSFYDREFPETDTRKEFDRTRIQFGMSGDGERQMMNVKVKDRFDQMYALTMVLPNDGDEAAEVAVSTRLFGPTEATERSMNESFVRDEEAHPEYLARIVMAGITGNMARVVGDLDGKLDHAQQPPTYTPKHW